MGANNSSKIVPSKSDPSINRKFILGIIDVQNDFCNGGALAVNEADHTIGPINKLRYIFDEHIKTFISQDWHNIKHMSFAETQGNKAHSGPHDLKLKMEDGSEVNVKQMAWPTHCVENTYGSQLHKDLVILKGDKIIKKGTQKNVESYSAFGDADNGKYEKTELYSWLKLLNITDIILTGIATDYCIYNTAKDAIMLGFKIHIIMSCTRGVAENTTTKAIEDLITKGVMFYNSVDEFDAQNRQYIITSNILQISKEKANSYI